jgi:hypothetical protein
MLRRLDGAWLLGQCLEFPLDPLPLPCRRLQTLPNSPAPKVLPFVAAWCRRAEKLTAANALRALGQVFRMREKAVASMSKFDFLISPTSPITAYAVDEATPGIDDWNRGRVPSSSSVVVSAALSFPVFGVLPNPADVGIEGFGQLVSALLELRSVIEENEVQLRERLGSVMGLKQRREMFEPVMRRATHRSCLFSAGASRRIDRHQR